MASTHFVIDPLFVGMTRPPMRWGVTYLALIANAIITMEVFLLTKQLLMLLLAAPIHGIFALLCARDPRFFELAVAWGRARLPAMVGNYVFWKSSSHSPLALDPPTLHGRRCRCPFIYL